MDIIEQQIGAGKISGLLHIRIEKFSFQFRKYGKLQGRYLFLTRKLPRLRPSHFHIAESCIGKIRGKFLAYLLI